MDRRHFLRNAGCFAGSLLTRGSTPAEPPRVPIPVIDTHIHLFDTGRKGGVPWPEKNDAVIYKPALPSRYKDVVESLGVVGAIAIEASPLRGDNDWLLHVAAQSPLIVGIVGDLQPDASDYAASLNTLRKNPLFRGIRYGNLWDRDLTADIQKPGFLDGLRRLADAGLVFESANPNPALIGTLADLAQRLPKLIIIVDHLPHATPPPVASERADYLHHLQHLGASPSVFVKLSEIAARKPGIDPLDLSQYRDTLDGLWAIFGEDKLLYGSDWPNSDHVLSYRDTFQLLQRYLQTKPTAAQEKVLWRNSAKAYAWHRRSPSQPG